MSTKKIIFLMVVIAFSIQPDASSFEAGAAKIKIAVKEFPPLVFNNLNGFCIDLAHIIAKKNNLELEFVMTDSVPSLLNAVDSGKCDMGFAGISITAEREKTVDFSQPFFDSGLMIAVKNEPIDHIASIGNTVMKVVGVSVLLLFFGLTIVAHLVWFIERDDQDQQGFPSRYTEGIMDAYWWAMVTMSTVGYGDKRPKKIGGRIIAAVWMFIGIVWFAGLTATLSSAFTLDYIRHGEIADLSDLHGRKVGVMENTTSEDFLQYHNIQTVFVTSFKELLSCLKDGRADAIVYDAPPLMHAAKLDQSIKVVGELFAEQKYGIVFPNSGGERLKELFDIGIMMSRKNGDYRKIYEKWF